MRITARALALVGVALAVLAVRVVTASRAELARGDRAPDHDTAIIAYRRAARWYAPGSPYPTRALTRLEEIATEAESRDDPTTALAAWRSIRGAALSARSFYVPFPERRARAESAIVRLTAETANAAGRREAAARARAGFARPVGPSVGWTVLLLLGWLAWTGGAFAFSLTAIDEEDRLRAGRARALGTVVVVGFGLFVIGMALA